MKFITTIAESFGRLLTSPGGELTRWEKALRYCMDLSWHCAKALRHDKATQMAASLTYRTIFSLIPVLVLSLVVFSAFPAFDNTLKNAQDKALTYLGLNTLDYELSADPEKPKQNLVAEKIDEAMQKIKGTSFASIGAIGFILLIWTALGLVISLEESFNQIFGVTEGRSLTRRVTLYWSALTLGPVLIFASAFMATQAVDYAREFFGQSIPILAALLASLSRFTALGATWLLLMFLYMVMPNTRVKLRSAAVGGFVAAVLWELAKYGFHLYVRKTLPYSAIYGTLGLVPLFLFWVYITWLIILFGLELTYTLQGMKGRQFKHDESKRADEQWVDPAWMLPLAARVARAFEQGKPCDAAELSRDMGVAPRAVEKMLHVLEDSGLIVRTLNAAQNEGVSLARPAAKITAGEILEASGKLLPAAVSSSNGDPAWQLVKQLHQSDQEKVKNKTLAELC